MRLFEYRAANSAAEAVALAGDGARYLGGGTNLIDLMKEDVAHADRLIDVSRLQNDQIEGTAAGGVLIGAAAKNAFTANHPMVRERYPLVSQAILAGATAQIRNMATNGGNLLQRTRCAYFYDNAMPCNKRVKGSGCGAYEGLSRTHAIFGASDQCVAVHPSDFCVALAAHDAVVVARGADNNVRRIPFVDFHRLPGNDATLDNNLKPDELIESIELLPSPFGKAVHYLKIRDRTSYAFALVSVAAAIQVEDGSIREARLALGGVAHKPWRALKAEAALAGKPLNNESFLNAADAELADARPLSHNAYKLPMVRVAIAHALSQAAGVA